MAHGTARDGCCAADRYHTHHCRRRICYMTSSRQIEIKLAELATYGVKFASFDAAFLAQPTPVDDELHMAASCLAYFKVSSGGVGGAILVRNAQTPRLNAYAGVCCFPSWECPVSLPFLILTFHHPSASLSYAHTRKHAHRSPSAASGPLCPCPSATRSWTAWVTRMRWRRRCRRRGRTLWQVRRVAGWVALLLGNMGFGKEGISNDERASLCKGVRAGVGRALCTSVGRCSQGTQLIASTFVTNCLLHSCPPAAGGAPAPGGPAAVVRRAAAAAARGAGGTAQPRGRGAPAPVMGGLRSALAYAGRGMRCSGSTAVLRFGCLGFVPRAAASWESATAVLRRWPPTGHGCRRRHC